MWDHGLWGMGSGCNRSWGGWCVTLAWAQTEQAETKFCMSPLISGHQNLRWMKQRGSVGTGVARELGGMTPLDDLRPSVDWNVKFPIGAFATCSFSSECCSDCLLDVHFYGVDEDLRAQNGVQFSLLGGAFEVSGESLRFHVLGSWPISEVEIEPGEEECPSSLAWVESLSRL